MLLKGKPVAEDIYTKIKSYVLPELTLTVFHPVGDSSADSYLRMKEKILKRFNFTLKVIDITNSHSKDWLIERINKEKIDSSVIGIMVEMPLPFDIDDTVLQSIIPYEKDVDGVSFYRQGVLFSSKRAGIAPCTSMAVIKILEYYSYDFAGTNALVIGRSKIIGLPAAKLLLDRNATVTVAHSKTKNLTELVKNADLVVVATGYHGVIKSSMLKKGAWLIDVGINFVNGKLVGDVYHDIERSDIYYTPVPGGVGPVTNAVLVENLVKLYQERKS